MDLSLAEFLFTIGFVMLGSLVFHVSTLISGYSIYREMSSVESGFLSTAMGLIVFLISPIGFIVLMPDESKDYAKYFLIHVLDFNVVISFLLSAMGLGLVFGHLAVLHARVNILTWLRDRSGIPFWIMYYGVLWDDFLTSVKKGGEIYIYKKSKNSNTYDPMQGALVSSSIRDEVREIEIELRDTGDKCIIPGEDIEYIRIPEKSFSRHYEKISHIGQAWCCSNVALGLFFIAVSSAITQAIISEKHIVSINLFYELTQQLLILSSVIILVLSVWIAKKDFDNWKSYFFFCPDFSFFSIYFSVLFLVLSFPIDLINRIIIFVSTIFLVVSLYRLISNNDSYKSDSSFYFFIVGMFLLYVSFSISEFNIIYQIYTGLGKDLLIMTNTYMQPLYSLRQMLIIGLIFLAILFMYLKLLRPRVKGVIVNELLEKKVLDVMVNSNNDRELYKIMEDSVHKMWLGMCVNDREKSTLNYLSDKLIPSLVGKDRKIANELIKALKTIEENKPYLRSESVTLLYMLHKAIKKKRSSSQIEESYMNSSENYIQSIVKGSLMVRSGEKATIFTDESRLDIADKLAGCLANSGSEVTIFMVPESIRPVQKVTDSQASALVLSDIIIYVLATKSNTMDLSKEVSFRHLLYSLPIQYKGRVCMMPGFTEEMKDAISIDYDKLKQRGNTLKRIMAGRQIRITSKLGTDISFSLEGRKLEIDDGDISKPGQFGNMPAGEIFTVPVEETVNGKIVIDGSIGGVGLVKKPFALILKAGQIAKMEPLDVPDETFQQFSRICDYDAPATKTLGEFGIGLNPGANIIGNILMDEKVEGSVHFAFGDSYGMGKTSSKFHTDLLVRNPTILADEEVIMKDGRFLMDLMKEPFK